MNKAVALFLDRDGVINVDHGHVGTRDRWEFMPGIFDLCRAACARGLQLIIVTNQAGIARGYYSEEDFLALTDWMKDQFVQEGVTISGVYFCPYHPVEGVERYGALAGDRKPAPGMLLRAAREHGLDLTRSVILGDKETDMQAGQAAGLGRLILLADEGEHRKTIAHVVVGQVADAIPYLPDMKL